MTKLKVGSAEVEVGGWESLGSTRNAEHYLEPPKLIITIYREGSHDDEEAAREQLAFQQEYMSAHGGGFDLVVLIDNLVSQDAASRRVYAKDPDPQCFRSASLVGGTFLSRGVASFFLGISNPSVPMKFFATLDDARAWLAKLDEQGRG